MSLGAAWALQAALHQHLSQDAALTPLIGAPARIYDQPPPGAAFPLVQLGAGRTEPYEGVEGGLVHTVRITIFSRWGGRRECKLIASGIRAVLQNVRLPLEGHEMVQARMIFEDHLRYRDPDTFQGSLRFRFITIPLLAEAA